MRELTLHLSGSAEGPYQRSIQTGIGRGSIRKKIGLPQRWSNLPSYLRHIFPSYTPDGFEHEYSCKERNVFFDIKACVSSNRISTDFG